MRARKTALDYIFGFVVKLPVAVAAMVLLFNLGRLLGEGAGMLAAALSVEGGSVGGEVTIAGNIEVVSQLDEDVWSGLSTRERLDTLQTVANIEAYYLGLPHGLEVRTDDLSGFTLACYDDLRRVITVDADYLRNGRAEEVLGSVCHEAYHAYQYRLCDLYDDADEEHRRLMIFRDARQYGQEFANYISGEEDAYGYYLQWCEIDARAYAQEAVDDYYAKIDAYLTTASASQT